MLKNVLLVKVGAAMWRTRLVKETVILATTTKEELQLEWMHRSCFACKRAWTASNNRFRHENGDPSKDAHGKNRSRRKSKPSVASENHFLIPDKYPEAKAASDSFEP